MFNRPTSTVFSIFLASLVVSTFAFPEVAENRIVGRPFVGCLPDGISLVAQTEHFFEGQIYVKGARKNANCLKSYSFNDNSTNLELKIAAENLEDCGFRAWPKPNSNSKSTLLSGQIIISFHRELVTSADRAFAAHCEFEIFRKKAEVLVENTIETHHLLQGTFQPPEIVMEIIPASDTNSKVLKVGDPLVFQWKIDSGIFGIQLETCSVTSETESRKGMRIIENGCSLDHELVSDSVTSEDFSRIHANSLAFKFPEEHVVFVRCAVRTCVRRTSHLDIIGGNLDDLCSRKLSCEKNSRNRRELKNLIYVNGRFDIEKATPKSNFLKSEKSAENPEFCMPELLYYLGLSSIIACHLITISTTLIVRFFKI